MTTPSASGTDPTVTVGVDLGGTGTRLVALDTDGVVVGDQVGPTAATGPPGTVIAALCKAIVRVAGPARISAVGIGASGPVDDAGVIHNPATLPAYSNVPIADWVSDRLGVPCLIDNDAATAALGEHELGAGRGSRCLLVVTLGTGIGVGIRSNGKAFRTAQGGHPEAGHLAVPGPHAPCYCGLVTCWEQLASRTALDRLTGGRTPDVARSARAGEHAALALLDIYGERVGVGLSTLTTVFEPDRVVIAGGAAQFLDLYRAGLDRAMQRSGEFAATATIRATELGAQSGALGAALMARDHG